MWVLVLSPASNLALSCTDTTSSAPPGSGATVLPQTRSSPWRRAASCLYELQRLEGDQTLPLVQDVGLSQTLQKLLGPVEIPHPHLHRPEALPDMTLLAGAGHPSVLGGKAPRVLV